MSKRKKLRFIPAAQYYAVVSRSSTNPRRWCEMASYVRWDTALSRVAAARRGGWSAEIVKVTRRGLVEPEELVRLGLDPY
jgi:hypothetical protein